MKINGFFGKTCILLAMVFSGILAVRAEIPVNPIANAGKVSVVPEKFLRRWDPVTFFFAANTGPAKGGAEDHPQRFVSMTPSQPGAYTWIDSKTLQFRPSVPWPALSKFRFRIGQKSSSLITLMEAPTGTIPADGEQGLARIDRITLTFAEPLDPAALRKMVRIGLRPLPGIDENRTRWLDQKDFELKVVERSRRTDPASYVLNLDRPIESGQRVIVRLRLSVDDDASETFKDVSFSTSESFRITNFGCANSLLPVTPEGVRYSRDQSISCNADQNQVQVQFSAQPGALGPIAARNLLRFTPAVEGLTFTTAGNTLFVGGHFLADTLYRVDLMPIPLSDTQGRPLQAKSASELYLHFPPKPKYLLWKAGHAIVERLGPQQLPLEGRGFGRVDLRAYRIDPLDRTFWPFPDTPIDLDESVQPPAPGEEPAPYTAPGAPIDSASLALHLRTLGSPPVSRIVKLPLQTAGSAARFGIDLSSEFAAISGPREPGTYLVGIRHLDESTQRSWLRVQVTDLSLTTVDETDGVKFAVTSLSTGEPVSDAGIRIEGAKDNRWVTLFETKTGSDGTAHWNIPTGVRGGMVERIVVQKGRDILVLDPTHAPDQYADNHWNEPGGTWLQWTQGSLAGRGEQSKMLCHVFSERPVYRPEEKVYIKGYVRNRYHGMLSIVHGGGTLVVEGPDGLSWRYPVQLSSEGSFDHVFNEANAPTGPYTIHYESGTYRCGNVNILKEAYRAPKFDVTLAAPDQVPLDRAFHVTLVSQYYAGGRTAGRPVRWRVTQFPYAWTPKAYPGFMFSSDGRFSGREAFRGSPEMEVDGKTDSEGSAQLELNPASETTGQPRSYVIEATVTGADDQTVTNTRRVLALPAVVLGLKTPRYLEHAKEVSPQFIVVGPDGKLVSGQDVTVRLVKRERHSYLRAADFSQAEAKYETEIVDRKILERKVKSEGKPLSVKLPLEGAGVYLVELEAHDRLGRAQTVMVDFYAGGDQPVTWSRPSSDVFKVTPDKDGYVPGETAHLVLESPFQRAEVLAIVEAPDGNRYQWIRVRNGAGSFDLPIEKDFVPQVPVHFALMRGRVPGVKPEPDGHVDLGKPATMAATSWVTVEPVENQVNVKLENPEKARPGQTITVKIRLNTGKGKPASGEVTLWLVDQAVLALGHEQRLDPLPDFITSVVSRLTLQDTRNWTLGILPFSELPGGDQGAKGTNEDLLDKVTLRRNFVSVPYYNPDIEVGPDGIATVSVKLPDNLTNFKLRAKAASGADRFGVGTGQVSVRLPVIVQPALPRFVRPGDSFTAAAIGRVVEGPGGAASAQLRVSGVDVSGDKTRKLDLKPNMPQRIEYKVSVPTPPVDAKGETSYKKVGFTFALERKSDQATDGFEVELPVRADREKISFRKLLDIQPGATAVLPAISEPVRTGSLRRSLLASDQPALVRIAAGLSFLMSYPYGCTEQRVSRARAFLAMDEFNHRLHKNGQDKELERVVDEVLKWLPGVIDENGLVSYWPGSRGYVSLTGWVTEFLVEAKNAGFNVDPAMIDKLTGPLRQALRSDYTHFITGEEYTERVMALRALAATGALDQGYLAELARRSQYMNLESSAEVLRLLYASGDEGSQFKAELAKRVKEGVVTRLYQGREIYGGLQDTASSRNGLILPSETRTLAEVTRAVASDPKADPRLQIYVDALVTLGRGDGWGSTQADASAMLALADVLKGKPGGEIQKLDMQIGTQSSTLAIGGENPIVDTATNSPAKITLHSLSKAPLIVRAETSYLPRAPGSEAKSEANGFVVTRELLLQNGPDNPADRIRLDKPGTTVHLKVGDIVEDHVEVISNSDHNQIAVVVPLAAGLEPLNPSLATAPPEAKPTGELTATPSYVSYLDDKVSFFYDSLPRGSYHFYFRTRATVAGVFTQPQARAEAMYDETVHGESVGAKIEVSPKPEK